MFRTAKLTAMMMIAALVAMAANAVTLRPLALEEQANLGATHEVVVKCADFATSTDTNTALVMSNIVIRAGQSVECVAMILTTAFDTANTNYTGSMALKVGDGTDDDLYLTSTELASDGSEVLFKVGRMDAASIASTVTKQVAAFLTGVTLQTVSLTDTNGITALVGTNIVSATANAMTNATVASTGTTGIGGYKLYTADNYLKLTATPNAEEALAANASGSVRILLRIR